MSARAFSPNQKTSRRVLCANLEPEDCVVQSIPDVSTTKWHLAHTTWFFETFILKRFVPGYRAEIPQYAYLFNSYYNAAGDMHRRDLRGLISRPHRKGSTALPLPRLIRIPTISFPMLTKNFSMTSSQF